MHIRADTIIEAAARGLRAVGDLILPRTCAVCGRRLNLDERHLCLPCLAELPLTHFWERAHNGMADRFNWLMDKDMTEGVREKYAYAAALFFYDGKGNYRRIPHRLKYHGDIGIGRHFGNMLGRKLAGCGHFRDVDMIIPVPLHWARRWKRGYNQAEVIAVEIARELGAEVRTDILRRQRRTRTQTKVAPQKKAANVSGAFAASLPTRTKNGHQSGACRRIPSQTNRGLQLQDGLPCRHILLVDDVFTTGSTLGACFVALRAVFPSTVRISVATLAFVGEA